MTEVPIKIRFSKSLNNLLPSRLIVVKPDNASDFQLYVTDKSGNPFPLKDEGGIINSIINSDGNLVITGTEDKIINISPALLSVINSALQTETDPIFQASEASLFVAGDKANLDNQSGINSGDETTLSIQTKRPLKTINGESLEGSGDVQIDYNDLDNLPTIPTVPDFADQTEVNEGIVEFKTIAPNTLAGWWTYVKGLAQTFAQKITFSSGALFSPQVAPTYEKGRIYFDNANDCISFMDSISGTSVQVGYEVLMRARNNTGATIPNGSVVYISGAIGQNSTVSLAQANTLQTSEIIGIATHDISNNTVGKICVFGLVNDLNTSSFTDGQMLYLSATVAGGLTSTIPASPNFIVALGVVEHAHPTQGKILVKPQRALANNNALGTAQNVPPTQNAVKTALDSKLDKDIATYPIASFPLADTDKLLLFQGGVPKKLDKSDLYKQTTITVELMNNLTSDFYAPNDLIIHSTDIIRGSGTISLKVENVAYTLGQLITRGNKITVETTTPSVYNLNTTPTNTNWQRPADWLPMPTNITAADQTFVGLHAVIENSDNYCAFSFTTSAGQYQVDWGDGNVTLHNSNTIAQHQYNYATVSNSTLSSRGYKQAMIKVTPISGNLLTCNFQQRFVTTPVQNQPYSSGFLDCILSMPNASSGQSINLGGATIRHTYCEKVDIKTIGNATNLTSLFNSFYSLQSIPLFNTINVTNMSSMLQNCFSLRAVPLFNTINVTNMASMLNSCYSLQSLPLFNTINVTNMATMFAYCYSLQSVPLFNTINVTNMELMFYNCYSLNFIPAFITTSVTINYTLFANACNSLNRILMSFNRTVALQNCQLSRDALVEIFTNLTNRTATTSATIDITGNWGASALTASDRLIATNKNWVITG